MNKCYDEIMDLIGAEEFKALVRKWDTLSGNIGNGKSLPRLIPNLLWVGNSGIGRTKLLQLMSAYLAAKGNLIDFYGDIKYFEFLLGYTPKEKEFTELQRLEDELSVAGGFRSEFRGVILIDITPWLGHHNELYFTSFMEYLAAHSDKWLIVLSVPELPEKLLNNLEAYLSMYLRLDSIRLTLPDTEALCRFVETTLAKYNLSFHESAKALLHNTIDELRNSPFFDGFKTIEMLCQDIIYEHFSSESAAKTLLEEADLSSFAPGSNYVKKVIKNAQRMRKIGFDRGEE